MSEKPFEPERVQIVSDLGQLRAFSHPVQARVLRILQKDEATEAEVAVQIGADIPSVREAITTLQNARLVVEAGQRDDGAALYRAAARFYGFRPEPGDLGLVAGPLSAALAQVVGQELHESMTAWPSQRMIGQLRRARLSPARLAEFEDRFEALVNEFWGSPDQPVDEREADPVLSLASVVYRYPEES